MTTAQTSTSQAATPAPIKHHWIITTQTAQGNLSTNSGSIDVTPGLTSRASAYNELREAVGRKLRTDQFVVLFFDLQPDQI